MSQQQQSNSEGFGYRDKGSSVARGTTEVVEVCSVGREMANEIAEQGTILLPSDKERSTR